jgi:hypothetical protein
MKFFAQFLLVAFLLLPLPCLAQLPAQLTNDFATNSGYLIMPIGDEYLVDLDASTDLQEGDILTLIVPGEKVIHPVTKDVLGSLDVPKGYLQVTRIKSGYSYAKLLFSETTPDKGDQVRRFEQVPTTFNGDNSQASNNLYKQLKAGLPQLNWLDNSNTTQPILTFSFKGSALSVESSSGNAFKTYKLVNGVLIAPRPATSNRSTFTVDQDPDNNKTFLNRTINNMIASVGLGKADKDYQPPGIIRNTNSSNNAVWFGPAMAGNPVGIAVADLDADGQQETAIAMDNSVRIIRIVQGQLVELAKIEIPAGLKLLSLDSADLDNNNRAELYVTANKNQSLASLVIEFNAGSYARTIGNIPWFIRAVDIPSEGRVLLGQSTDSSQTPFAGKPFLIVRNGDALEKGREIDLPKKVNAFNFIPFDQDGSDSLFAYLTANDYLKVVNPQGDELWKSGDYFGGSETVFYNQKAARDELPVPIYMPQRILRTATGDILCSQNDGSRILQRYRAFKDSRVVALNWNGYAMTEQWRTTEQKGYLADFTLADTDNDGEVELVMAMKFQHKSLFNKPRSTIVVYEMN